MANDFMYGSAVFVHHGANDSVQKCSGQSNRYINHCAISVRNMCTSIKKHSSNEMLLLFGKVLGLYVVDSHFLYLSLW